jgi:hypothetical protein
MVRVLRLLMLLLMLGHAAPGIVGGDDACGEGCEDDASGKRCPPVCPTCSCTVRVAPVMASAILLAPPPTELQGDAAFGKHDDARRSPDPDEILHVPRLSVLTT